MSLPLGTLAKGTVEIDGAQVPIRSLSRAEVIASPKDELEAEAYFLRLATDSSEAEAIGFLETHDVALCERILTAIQELSGIPTKGTPDPLRLRRVG